MAKHVSMYLKRKVCLLPCPLDHPVEAIRREWSTAFAHEYTRPLPAGHAAWPNFNHDLLPWQTNKVRTYPQAQPLWDRLKCLPRSISGQSQPFEHVVGAYQQH